MTVLTFRNINLFRFVFEANRERRLFAYLFTGYTIMRKKTTRVISNSQVQSEYRPALVLTDAALLEIESDDAPALTLTPAACLELQAQTVMDALNAFDYRPIMLAEEFHAAKEAYEIVQGPMDHDAFMQAQEAFNKACRSLFFTMHTWLKA